MVTLHQIVGELFDCMSTRPIFAFCSVPEIAGDVTSGTTVEDVGIDARYCRLNRSRDIRPAHFVSKNEQRLMSPVAMWRFA